MDTNPHFRTIPSWGEVEAVAGFAPRIPRETLGRTLNSLQLFVRNHRMRDVPPEERSLEAHFGSFVFSQRRCGPDRARALALETSYGAAPITARIGGHEARAWALGPEVASDDPDGRAAAVVTWADGERFFLVASHEVDYPELLRVAGSLYGPARPDRAVRVVRAAAEDWRDDVPGTRYREVALERLSFTVFELDPHAVFDEHHHPNEQITHVLEGVLEFVAEGEVVRLGPGDTIAIPADVPHSVRALEARVLAVDAWSPPPEHLG